MDHPKCTRRPNEVKLVIRLKLPLPNGTLLHHHMTRDFVPNSRRRRARYSARRCASRADGCGQLPEHHVERAHGLQPAERPGGLCCRVAAPSKPPRAALCASATNASLTLTNVQTSFAASYTVVITNAYGAVTSAPAALTVKLGQAITFNALTNRTFVDSPFALTASASSGLPVAFKIGRAHV